MVELLAPAGSMDALKAAIAGGANAIYVGGSRFNARAYATNFTIDQLQEAVKLCHLHNVRLFVTVNTLYKESEINDLYDYLCDLYHIQVDALIVQDEGIMRFIQKHFKDFEIHASTQCSIHNVDGVKHYQQLGLKRCVVARENTLDEIKQMVATGMEIEAFIHGALCVSYSGQCLMSQMIGKRSANRGMCAQPCRLPYNLIKDGKVISKTTNLMSCKDLCTIEHIQEMIDAGITSFKIEGRMKRPEYVYAITKAYRMAIDHHELPNIEMLMQLFNRDFTKGYLFHEKTIVSDVYAGNRGICVGQVIDYDKRQKRLKIKALKTIHQQDGIRIGFSDEGKILNKIYEKNKLVNQVQANNVFEIDYDSFVKKDTYIYRTQDSELEKNIHRELLKNEFKSNVIMELTGRVGEKATLIMSDGTFEVSVVTSEILEKANQPINLERLETQLKKLGNTIYEAKEVQLHFDSDAYIAITQINQLRRDACCLLDEKRMNKTVRDENVILPLKKVQTVSKKMKSTYIHCHTINQVQMILPISDDEMIYLDLNENFIEYKKQYPQLGLVIPTIASEKVLKQCDDIVKEFKDISIAVGNIGAYERYKNNVTLLLPAMNLSHTYALESYDVPAVLSLDMDKQDEKLIKCDYIQMTYGHIDNMTTKHCVVSYHYFGKKVEGCHQCLKGDYQLSDRMDAKFPLLFDNDCICHVLSEKPIQKPKGQNQYLRFTIENKETTAELLRKYRNI